MTSALGGLQRHGGHESADFGPTTAISKRSAEANSALDIGHLVL